jgi:hypothetical protein
MGHILERYNAYLDMPSGELCGVTPPPFVVKRVVPIKAARKETPPMRREIRTETT